MRKEKGTLIWIRSLSPSLDDKLLSGYMWRKVEETQTIKILGANLDNDLNYRDHIRGMCKKVGGMIGILRRLKNLTPVNARLLLYKSAIMSHLTYCHLVWYFCMASYSRKLERLQERALRLVYNTTTDQD